MRGKGESIALRLCQILALSFLVIGGAVLITGCEKEKQEIAKSPRPTPTPCPVIDPPAFVNQSAHTRLGTSQVCVTAGKCVATQVDTENKMAGKYCDRNHTATCQPGNCSSGSCKPKFDVNQSSFLYIRGCSVQALGPPACAVGEELCECTLYVSPRGELDCDCGCR